MARRLNRLVSIVLSAAVVVLSSGLDAQRAAAQTFTGRAAPVSATPQLGMSLVNAPMVSLPVFAPMTPGLSAPAALTASPLLSAPVAAAALKPVAPAAAIAEKLLAATPALQALAKPELGGSAASIAGRDLEDVLTGVKSAKASSSDDSVAGAASALAPALSAPSASEAPKAADVPAAAPAPFKSIASASSYRAHRVVLRAVAALAGAVFTLPQAGPALTAKIIASAADKSLVLSDFDDTLAGYNEVLPADKVAAIQAIRKAGKHFAVISDRGDTKRPGQAQLTVFESLESIPAADRAGMYVAANSGGKIYRYDEQGVPQKVHEATVLTEAQTAKIKEAAAAAKARLSEAGAVQHAGDEKVPGESYNSYGYALMLKPGSSQDAVKGAARILNEELAKRGFEVEVQPRFAKSAENPPYATFSIITKAEAASYIAGALEIEAKDALVIGDAMFIPRDASKPGFLSRLGERLSGRPQAKTGNETDRNMTKNLPGVLALGVGAAMDPRTPNGWALAGHGPEVTQKVLESVASKARRFPGAGEKSDRMETISHLTLLAAFAVMGAVSLYVFSGVLNEIIRLGEEAMRGNLFGHDFGFYLGGTTLGMVGMAGMLGHVRSILTHPQETFAQAQKKAVEIAVESGAKAEDVRFVEATANMPVLDGAQWKYTFSFPTAKHASNLVYVDFENFFGGAQDFRARVYEGAVPSAKALPFGMSGYLFGRGVTLSPDAALGLVRKAEPAFGAGVSVSLGVQEEPVSGDKDAWYRIYDNHGNFAEVNARTAEVRVVRAAARVAKAASAGLKHAVEPNELYALALENLKAVAPKDAQIRFLSAVHESRWFNGAWVGDEWRYFFGWGDTNGGLQYMVPARRTMITETMMDAFEPELRGAISAEQLASGVDAALFNRAVVTTPDAALAAVDGVTRVSLLPRVEPGSGDKDLWYSLQRAGSEAASVNARTGEVRKNAAPAPDSALKSFGLWLIGAALVVAIYGGFYWAMAHAPAAVPQGIPEGYNGPVPSIDQIFRGAGGVLGLGFLAGTIGRGKKAKLTDDDIRASAAGVISYKGRPWSQTEYNSVYYPAIESLKARGATQLQLALFETLCAEAPVKGGSFNPWSGD